MIRIAARPFEFTLPPGHTALVVIDMQRDFVEPGGFGASLGNDVSLLASAIGPTHTLLGLWRERGWPSCTRARRTGRTSRTARRPSATAASRRCASATPGRWAGCW
jgi:nicotinamidase-related amidase